MSIIPLNQHRQQLQFDGSVSIATANSRMSTQWKNQDMRWSDVVARLSNTSRTAETIAEYKRMPKSQQDDIKDVGGFVGGLLTGGRRLVDTVAYRSMLTLDADHLQPGADIWGAWTLMSGAASLIYSTHKHEPQSPRLRLVIPLQRSVSPEEYQAISRKVAHWLGIDQFDDTTYQPHRLMYYPSTASDAEFYCQIQDGPWLSPDEVLAEYHDWRDVSQWPESSRRAATMQRHAEVQGDPTQKPGIVGYFCQTYDVPAAIESFLPGVYVGDGDRYTYSQGSTSGGAILYDGGNFLYSHHGTDPVSGQLVNAFDLVRLHRFGDRDLDMKPGTPVVKSPSYLLMQELASSDTKVKQTIVMSRHEAAKAMFSANPAQQLSAQVTQSPGAQVPAAVSPLSWEPAPTANESIEDVSSRMLAELAALLEVSKSGTIQPTIDNAYLILTFDPALSGCFGLNEFTGRVSLRRNLPWRIVHPGENWSDNDEADLKHYAEKRWGFSAFAALQNAWKTVSRVNAFHPVREYLGNLVWDGKARLETLLVDYLGALDSEYTRAVTRKALVGAVARVMQPGCKFDYVLTLLGPQGIGKTSIFQQLAGAWFSDSFTTFAGKEAYEQLRGAWIVEMGEMAAAKKSDIEAMKHFITKRVDSYRVAYGHHVEDFKRQNIFIGTTNDPEFLRDRTGNRRFWTVSVGIDQPTKSIWDDLVGDEVGQIWAEALAFYHFGEELMLTGNLVKQAQVIQESHTAENGIAGQIASFLDIPITEDWYDKSIRERQAYFRGWAENDEHIVKKGTVRREKVSAIEIWCEMFGRDRAHLGIADAKEIGSALLTIPEWSRPGTSTGRLRLGVEYGSQKAYLRSL